MEKETELYLVKRIKDLELENSTLKFNDKTAPSDQCEKKEPNPLNPFEVSDNGIIYRSALALVASLLFPYVKTRTADATHRCKYVVVNKVEIESDILCEVIESVLQSEDIKKMDFEIRTKGGLKNDNEM